LTSNASKPQKRFDVSISHNDSLLLGFLVAFLVVHQETDENYE
jgi:hypothetical protein